MRLSLEEKRFPGGAAVLADLQLDVAAGEFLALLGPSGSGKTTLLRILARLDTEFFGELDWTGGPPKLGYLFQEARLMPWLTALENVRLVAGGDEAHALAALEDVGLGAAAARYPHQLSGGMQRRVALARALVGEPDLLLLDEPFVSLDQPSADDLRTRLRDHWAQARPTVVLVSHDLREAVSLADRLCFLGGSPSGLVLEKRLDPDRPWDPDGSAARDLSRELLESHPRILSGVLGQES